MILSFSSKLITLVLLTWKYERLFRTILSCLLKIDHSDKIRKSDYKFSAVSEICFENIENSKTDAVSEKKLVKIIWVIVFRKLKKSIRSYQDKN